MSTDLIEQLRDRLQHTQEAEDSVAKALEKWPLEDQQLLRGKGFRPAAVLILLVAGSSPQIVFTKRAAHLKHHSGEFSFPGGGYEDQDESHTDTALREAYEEIGLITDEVEVIGYGSPRITISGYAVQPVIGVVGALPNWRVDENEVESVFVADLKSALDLRFFTQDAREVDGKMRSFYRIKLSGEEIWGATAGMLHELALTLSK